MTKEQDKSILIMMSICLTTIFACDLSVLWEME